MTEWEQKAQERLDKLSQAQLNAVLWYLMGFNWDNEQFYKDVLYAVDSLEAINWNIKCTVNTTQI
jgi:hypothetical protein